MAFQGRDDFQPIRTAKKRATKVCFRCHDKKIKCDLQVTLPGPCTNCKECENECELRRPNRRRRFRHSLYSSALSRDAASLPNLAYRPPMDVNASAMTPMCVSQPLPSSAVSHGDGGALPRPPKSYLSPDSTVDTRYFHDSLRGGHEGRLASTSLEVSSQEPDSSTEDATASYLSEPGFFSIFDHDPEQQNPRRRDSLLPGALHFGEVLNPALQRSYLETYHEYCYTFGPILDRDNFFDSPFCESLLLQQAIALVGSTVTPPVITHGRPDDYYERMKSIFYGNYEPNPIAGILALMMLYWRGRPTPSVVSIDSVWWWTGTAIRLAQQVGLHREVLPGQSLRPGETPGLRRRIWWTLYARERLTGIYQGRPCIIDPEDCDIAQPSVNDFPNPRDVRAEIFIFWVRLCDIVGRLGKYLARKNDSTPAPKHLAAELSAWVHSLPPHLQLPISDDHTLRYNRDVHQLHLPYLTAITLLHLKQSSNPLPQACTAAILASACVARVFEDFLARGRIRFLQGIAGWYVSIALFALLHARKIGRLKAAAERHIQILRLALKEIAKLWSSARLLDNEFEQLLDMSAASTAASQTSAAAMPPDFASVAGGADLPPHIASGVGIDWMEFFPYLTPRTSPLVAIMLNADPMTPFAEMQWPEDLMTQLQEFFGPLEDTSGQAPSMPYRG